MYKVILYNAILVLYNANRLELISSFDVTGNYYFS